ncbi:MAG: GNAT family N-acetyltransferase [Anaerolineae bacterium]|nr:GNAT family N-acetyltransferase [Anaerolineae bacterium]
MTNFRRATPTDTKGIATVVYDVWAQDILTDVCAAQIQDDTCALWVAADKDDIAGFVSAFLTVCKDGDRRWEVDLVAVRRASQGQHLGQRLVAKACQDARMHNVSVARAIVRVDNIASQRTFENAGFTTDWAIHKLLLWTPKSSDNPIDVANSVALLPMDTLTYRGLWIEGLTWEGLTTAEQRQAIRAARSMVAKDGRLNAGALIPIDEEHLLATDLRDEARVHGEYYWFIKPKEALL